MCGQVARKDLVRILCHRGCPYCRLGNWGFGEITDKLWKVLEKVRRYGAYRRMNMSS